MSKTPHKTGKKIDEVIDRLNATWNLQIPRLHGDEAVSAGGEEELARKCASRIRFLCWKGQVNLDGVIEDFSDRAAQKQSGWVYKPSQQSGTLPSLPITKSFLKRDAVSKLKSNTKSRSETLQILADLLEEEYRLATESSSYQRTSVTSLDQTSKDNSFHDHRSISTTSFATAVSSIDPSVSESLKSMPKPTNRLLGTLPRKRKAAAVPQTNPEHKKQQTLSQVYRRSTDRRNENSSYNSQLNTSMPSSTRSSTRNSTHEVPSNSAQRSTPAIQETSFKTEISEDLEDVFSDSGGFEPSSNNTSMLSLPEVKEESQYGGTQTLLEREILESFECDGRLKAKPRRTPDTVELLRDIAESGPFKQSVCQLPGNLPYWCIFELYRVSSQVQNLQVGDLYYAVKTDCPPKVSGYNSFWESVKSFCKSKKIDNCPPRSKINEWTTVEDFYCDQKTGDSVSFSARLDFAMNLNQGLFELKLKPMTKDRSCRFHRKFGADRFMALDIPVFAPDFPKGIPEKLRKQFNADELNEKIFSWLVLNDLHVAGRTWRAFWIEPIDNKSKRKEEGLRQKLHLFATDGFDFGSKMRNPISLQTFLNWHLAILENKTSSDLKLFERLHLGLSKTKATVVLERHQFIHVPDKKPTERRKIKNEDDDDIIMTDGCASISLSLAKDVWQKMRKSEDPDEVPSAFQARISGAKGLWIVDPSGTHDTPENKGKWLEVSDSQLKIKPHPRYRKTDDEHHLTFEVVQVSSKCSTGHLNTQLITVLESRKVPRQEIAELMRAELAEYSESLSLAMKDPIIMRKWSQMHHPSQSSRTNMDYCGAMPNSRKDELEMLLEAGFHPANNIYMVEECLWNLVKQYLDRYVQKFRIEMKHATNLFCVPDPLGLLRPGEIQLNFSEIKPHPVTGFLESSLQNLTVLVARNPAYLPSDVQSVKAVYYRELHYLTDVIIFPIQGECPLAGMLSGGDYDGDTVTVIWDPKITAPFRSVSVPKLASKSECDIESDTRPISAVFPGSTCSDVQTGDFMFRCCTINGISSKLGHVTKLFEKLVYTNPENLMTPEGGKLGALAGYLVDSGKSGDKFSTRAWHKISSHIHRLYKLPESKPSYLIEGADDTNHRDAMGRCVSVLDFLKFEVAVNDTEKLKIEFSREYMNKKIDTDIDLKELCNSEWNRAESRSDREREAVKALMTKLKEDITNLYKEWRARVVKADMGKDSLPNDYRSMMEEFYEKLLSIEPLMVDCDIRREFLRRGGHRGSLWSQLRASSFYYLYPSSTVTWKLVGDELCNIKATVADKNGCRSRRMIQPMRHIMKVNTKKWNKSDTDADEDEGKGAK